MTNNDVLRRLRFAFDFKDAQMIAYFAEADYTVSRAKIVNWMKKDEDPAYVELSDKELAIFLDGMIISNRGKQEGVQRLPETELNNNIIFKKIKIALSLKDTDIIEMIELSGLRISKTELSAFFRNPKHSLYKRCQDQFLRNFIYGLQKKHRKI